jgi:hypothetical protein
MSIQELDFTGEPPSDADLVHAVQSVKRALFDPKMMQMPEFAAQLPNILRCLQDLCALRTQQRSDRMPLGAASEKPR